MAKARPKYLRFELAVFFLQTPSQWQQSKQLSGRSDPPTQGTGRGPMALLPGCPFPSLLHRKDINGPKRDLPQRRKTREAPSNSKTRKESGEAQGLYHRAVFLPSSDVSESFLNTWKRGLDT